MRRALLLPVCLCALTSAALADVTEGADPLAAWSAWWALGEGEKPVPSEIPVQLAILRAADLHRLNRAMTLHRKLDPEAETLVTTVRTKINSMALAELYALMGTAKTPKRKVAFTGRLAPEGYVVKMNKKTRGWGQFGDLDSSVALTPVQGAPNYVLRTETRLHLGALRAKNWFGFWRSGRDWVTQATQDAPPTARAGLDSADHRLLSQIEAAFPSTYAFFTRYVTIEDLIAPMKGQPLRARLRFRLKLAPLKKDYPRYAEQLERLKKMEFRARVIDKSGQPVAVLKAGGAGALKVALDVDLSLGRIWDEGFTTEAAWRADLFGLKIAADDLDFRTEVNQTPERQRYCTTFTKVPKVTITGAAFDLISTDMIDALIPDTLQVNLNRVMNTFAKGNGGKGMRACSELPVGSERWVNNMEIELMGEGLFTQMMRLGAQFSSQDEALRKQRLAFRKAWLDAYKTDLDRMQGLVEQPGLARKR